MSLLNDSGMGACEASRRPTAQHQAVPGRQFVHGPCTSVHCVARSQESMQQHAACSWHQGIGIDNEQTGDGTEWAEAGREALRHVQAPRDAPPSNVPPHTAHSRQQTAQGLPLTRVRWARRGGGRRRRRTSRGEQGGLWVAGRGRPTTGQRRPGPPLRPQ